jgi:hypothetical protein
MPRVSIWDIISLSFGLKGNLEKEELVPVDEEKVITNESFRLSLYKHTAFPPYCFWGGLRSFFQGWNSDAGR